MLVGTMEIIEDRRREYFLKAIKDRGLTYPETSKLTLLTLNRLHSLVYEKHFSLRLYELSLLKKGLKLTDDEVFNIGFNGIKLK